LHNTEGFNNIASGYQALLFNTSGSINTAVGVSALEANTIGNNNTAIGAGAGETLTVGSDNIYLGNTGTDSESGTMRLGGSQTKTTFIAGIVGVAVSGSPVLIGSNGQLGIQASSIRYKRDIQPMSASSRGLMQLRPVVFRYKQDAQGERQYGLIAEEVAKVYPELVTRGAKGEVESVRYHELVPMLINEMQHQQRQLGAQAQQLTAQAQQLAELKAQNEFLRTALGQQQERDATVAARLE